MSSIKFEVTTNSLDKISADAIIVFAFQGKEQFEATEKLHEVDKALGGKLVKSLELENFKGKEESTFKLFTEGLLSPRVIVLGLGKKEEFVLHTLRKAMASLAKNTGQMNSLTLSVLSENDISLPENIQAHVIIEGIILGGYKFVEYKKSKGDKKLEIVIFSTKDNQEAHLKNVISNAELFAQATVLARDLVNEPPTTATPTYLAKIAEDIAKANRDVTAKIYDKKECEKMGMGAFLGIARAAETPPKFIYLHYTPAKKSNKKLAIVGKGITFDSGGINVKPGDHMQTMKMDMAGAAAVLGIFSVISKIKPEFEVMGLIAATPNMISGSAIVPGDIVKAMNGKTIEILNTDAEGRVTLADALSFAVKEKATEIIDLSTLTGACVVALGDDIAGLFGNNRDIVEKVKKSAFDAGEEVWELPLPKEYKIQNKSSVADIANIANTRWGGALTAALFLEEFVDNIAWAHMDIAGPAFAERSFSMGPKGGTGFGVRMLLHYISEKHSV